MNLKKLFVLLAACVFATLALAGCGGSDSASSGSGTLTSFPSSLSSSQLLAKKLAE